MEQVQQELKVSQKDQLVHKVQQIQKDLKTAQSEVESLTAKLMKEASAEIFKNVKIVDDITYIATSVENQSMDSLRSLGDTWQSQVASNIFVVASQNEGAVSLLVLVDDQTVAKGIKAGNLIKPLAKIIGGGGGGRPTMAQAGGKNPSGIGQMLEAVPEEIHKLA